MTTNDRTTLRQQIARDIKLAVLTDLTPAGRVYVDLEGINPRIAADIDSRNDFVKYANRVLSILTALHGEFRADPTQRMRGMTFHCNPDAYSDEDRAAARPALKARLAQAGCSKEAMEKLLPPSD
ncbi:hypothetical protein HTT03_13810 [Sulfitobacter sp. S0837]|uniref:hypothetical protein n=1 Tax=Sulfitobacter maritimus TaxID=2741719 RepID=UPI00158403F5|nr:hypothetical protein [Sulfitobacter maritimus]NUH66360.1 hypothetical protein [Sulfitobacter maritimus]